MFSSSATAARHAHNPSSVSQESARQAIDKARQAMQRNGVKAETVRSLRADLGGDQDAFHDAILTLLDHARQHPSLRQSLPALIEHARNQHFDLNARGTEGKTVLDLAMRHDDLELARHLLGEGANPERTSTVAASAEMRTLLTAWRRQNLLYAHFNEGNSQGLTGLDHMLQEGRHDEIRALIGHGMTRDDVQYLWETAMAAGQHDILRTLLIVGTPEQLRELTRRQSEVGRWQAELREDPGLSAVLKEFPYQSAKRGLPQNFNEKASFNPGEKIACRHLATYQQEEQARDPHIKFNYDKFRDPTEIANNVKPDIQKTWEALKAHASEAHLIDNAKFGQFLSGQFAAMEEAMKEGRNPTRLMLVESTKHTMNLGLRIKDDEEGKRSYVVKFFDPNDTTTGTRSKADSVQTFEMQTIASYITDEESLRAYYPEARGLSMEESLRACYPEDMGLSMIFVRPEGAAQASTAISAGVNVDRTLTTCIDTEDIDAIAVFHLMDNGFAGNLKQLHAHLETLPEDRRIEIITGKCDDGMPALFMSMQNGHAETVKVYGELVALIPEMPEKELIELIAAKDTDDVPGLFMSMSSGHAEVINAYGELLALIPEIPEKELIKLIAAKDTDGTPALFMSMQEGHAEAVNAYGKLLALIPEQERIELIAGKNGDDTPALFMSMQEGRAKAVNAYGKLLALIPEKERIELITGKRGDGTPALFVGMQGGDAETVKAYGELLTLIPEMPEKERVELIAAKDADGTPALFMSMYKGHAEAVKAYGDLLTPMSEDQRIELIAGEAANGASALYIAMGSEQTSKQTEVIKAYGELLKMVPPDKQAELLLAKNSKGLAKGQSGLHVALEKGKFEMVKVLLNMLEELVEDLSPDQRASLRQELKDYEARIVQCPFQSNRLSRQQYGEMTIKFSNLMNALKNEGA